MSNHRSNVPHREMCLLLKYWHWSNKVNDCQLLSILSVQGDIYFCWQYNFYFCRFLFLESFGPSTQTFKVLCWNSLKGGHGSLLRGHMTGVLVCCLTTQKHVLSSSPSHTPTFSVSFFLCLSLSLYLFHFPNDCRTCSLDCPHSASHLTTQPIPNRSLSHLLTHWLDHTLSLSPSASLSLPLSTCPLSLTYWRVPVHIFVIVIQMQMVAKLKQFWQTMTLPPPSQIPWPPLPMMTIPLESMMQTTTRLLILCSTISTTFLRNPACECEIVREFWYACARTRSHKHTHIHKYKQIRTHKREHTHTHALCLSLAQTHTHTHTHTHTRAHTHTSTHTYSRIHTDTRPHTHTHTRTHAHTFVCTDVWSRAPTYAITYFWRSPSRAHTHQSRKRMHFHRCYEQFGKLWATWHSLDRHRRRLDFSQTPACTDKSKYTYCTKLSQEQVYDQGVILTNKLWKYMRWKRPYKYF